MNNRVCIYVLIAAEDYTNRTQNCAKLNSFLNDF